MGTKKKQKESESPIVYMITGIVPYSGRDRSVIYVYLNKEKAEKRYEELRKGDSYLDVQMDTYEVDD
jgi:hypothetical protein